MSEESSSEPEEQSQDPSTEARKGLSESSYPQAQQYTITNVSYSKFRLPLRQSLTSDASKNIEKALSSDSLLNIQQLREREAAMSHL